MYSFWPEFLKVAIMHLLAVASPGPDFAIVLRQSLLHGRRTGVWTAIGIGSAICLHVTYSLCGLGLLLRGSPAAFKVLRFSGAAYLAWLGLRALRAAPLAAVAADPAEPPAEAPRPRAAWATGFLTNALNPKVALFLIFLFAAVISPRAPVAARVLYGGWISLTTMGWFALVASVFAQEAPRRAYLRCGHWIDRALGIVFLGFAASLAASTL
jgi:threonine/homoserine/homoserine lactone efflux protein